MENSEKSTFSQFHFLFPFKKAIIFPCYLTNLYPAKWNLSWGSWGCFKEIILCTPSHDVQWPFDPWHLLVSSPWCPLQLLGELVICSIWSCREVILMMFSNQSKVWNSKNIVTFTSLCGQMLPTTDNCLQTLQKPTVHRRQPFKGKLVSVCSYWIHKMKKEGYLWSPLSEILICMLWPTQTVHKNMASKTFTGVMSAKD